MKPRATLSPTCAPPTSGHVRDAVRESNIERALCSLAAAIGELDTRIGLLIEGIGPVLSPEVPDNPEKCENSVAPMSPLEERILGARMELDRMIGLVNRTRERVQL